MELLEFVAFRILQICEEKEMSIKKLSEISDVPLYTLNQIIKSKRKIIQTDLMIKILYGLDVTLDEFLDSPKFRSVEEIDKNRT